MIPEIKLCPNCGGKLTDNKKLAQGAKECVKCKCNFFILITSYKK